MLGIIDGCAPRECDAKVDEGENTIQTVGRARYGGTLGNRARANRDRTGRVVSPWLKNVYVFKSKYGSYVELLI